MCADLRPLPYRAYLFDFDGTLADSLGFLHETLDRLARKHRFRPVPADELDSLRRLTPRQICARVGLPLWKLPAVSASYLQLARDAGHAPPLFAGIEALLEKIHQRGSQLALVTSNSEDILRASLGPAFAHFAHVETRMSIFGKARRLQRTLRRLAVAPGEALFLGDTTSDRQAAAQAGIPFGAVSWGYNHPETLAATAPEHLFFHPRDILQEELA